MKFRQHRGGSLKSSMETLVEVENQEALQKHIDFIYANVLGFPWKTPIKISLYINWLDARVGWQKTYVVVVDGWGPIGFTDSTG